MDSHVPAILFLEKSDHELLLVSLMAKLHGLIAGAPGTDKTIALQI